MEFSAARIFKKRFFLALGGTVAVALCCFTPVLVIALAALGLSSLTRYLDFVLLPALLALIVIAAFSYRKWKAECRAEGACRENAENQR